MHRIVGSITSLAEHLVAVVTDAEITCLSPGARFAGLKAPVVMVISRHKQLLAPIG